MPAAPFRAFLSHRYKSPRVNEYFFRLFDNIGAPHFRVDKGRKPTCVTRLERMVRDSDGFIGFYAFPADAEPSVEKLRQESSYFRLELDLAHRAGKPSILFIDERYGAVLRPPPSMTDVRFRDAEAAPGVHMPREPQFKQRIEEFCDRVQAASAYGLSTLSAQQSRTKVGILLPPDEGRGNGYTSRQVSLIAAEIEALTPQQAVPMPWPPILDSRFAANLEEIDWMVVDVGPVSAASGIVSYLHGRFVPMLRLRRLEEPAASPISLSPLEQTLFGSFDVGYPKDIVRWFDETTLKEEVDRRIALLSFESTYVADLKQALEYFNEAALRKETVFVSYTGKDDAKAAPIIKAIKEKFQKVFDYRAEDRPIPAGSEWLEEIFKTIAVAPVGVLLLSPDYIESGNCRHEMNEMIAQKDAGKMKIVPIRLREVSMPPALGSIQYLRSENFGDADQIVAALIADLDKASKA